MKSRSEQLFEQRLLPPLISNAMYKNVSQYRRGVLEEETSNGFFRDGATNNSKQPTKYDTTSASYVSYLKDDIKKQANFGAGEEASRIGGAWRGGDGRNTVRQMPEVYSPLWLNSNLNLPRDRATINAWNRSFYALNPIVQNSINLHSTYPISKLSIKCPNKKIEQFFNAMIEEIDLMNICVQAAQEYWLLGETFIYAELDEASAKWSRLIIQNPDYIVVKRSVMANEPIIMMRPDENLRRIVFSNRPADLEQKSQLNPSIVEHIKRGENIPLDNFYVSHLARRISPYEIRGTGLPVCCFRDLMLWDLIKESKIVQAQAMITPLTIVKIGNENYKPTLGDIEAYREVFACHDEETEVLTENGFKKYHEVMDFEQNSNGKYNAKPKSYVKIACFNTDTEQLEYHAPTAAHLHDYSGEMYHYKNYKIDLKVTPNHDLWASKKLSLYTGFKQPRVTGWGDWQKIKAQDLDLSHEYKFRSEVKWKGKEIEYVDILDRQVPIELYLEFLGYLLSEGSLTESIYSVRIAQSLPKYKNEMSDCLSKFAKQFDLNMTESYTYRTEKNIEWSDMWNGSINNKELFYFMKNECQDEFKRTTAYYKHIPRWVLELSPRLLKVLLRALVMGDGSFYKRQSGDEAFRYSTTSKELSNGVFEAAYKAGYVPVESIYDYERTDHIRQPIFETRWSTTALGRFPRVYKTFRHSQTKRKTNMLHKVGYTGKVWCFTVPTGLFITKRGGKITIQGNSAEYDKQFKIFTHEGVSVERVGWNAAIIDTSNDITQTMKNINIGLMVPSVLMDSGDITYANGSVSLDVLRQRYFQFRNMMAAWLKNKIFAPISKLNDFYEFEGGEKKLIIPEVEWNHMSLFETMDYVNVMVQLSGDPKKVSHQTLYRSLGLDYDDERRKIRHEDVSEAIRKKEIATLDRMPLNELRGLGDDEEIPEIVESADPNESPYSDAGQQAGGGSGGMPPLPGMPGGDLGLGGLSSPPPPPPSLSPPGGGPAAPAPTPTPKT